MGKLVAAVAVTGIVAVVARKLWRDHQAAA
jgi:hypothetical protein